MHSGQHKNKISDIETDDSYWGFGRYCMHGDLIVWNLTVCWAITDLGSKLQYWIYSEHIIIMHAAT